MTIIIASLVAIGIASARWGRTLVGSAPRTEQRNPVRSADSTEAPHLSFAGHTMGGTWSVKLAHPSTDISIDTLHTSIADLLDRFDRQMSIWKPQSDVSAFNRYIGENWFPVSQELAEVVFDAQRVSEQTDGAFDVTVAPLVLLWGFGPARMGGQVGQIPADSAIAEARSHVGYHLLQCQMYPPALRKRNPRVYVDLGGIAKGYAVDAVGKHLEACGIHDYLIAVGGELRARGKNIAGKPWRVGIETPTPDVRRIFCQLDLSDCSLSTSGDYRNFFQIGEKRFCHEIDPRTGRPIESLLASVSVIHESGAYADAMATALMVLGPRDGYDRATRLNLAAMFIVRRTDHFETLRTPLFDKLSVTYDAAH